MCFNIMMAQAAQDQEWIALPDGHRVHGTKLVNAVTPLSTLQEAATALYIPINELRAHFQITSGDNEQTLATAEINIESVYQFFYTYHKFNDSTSLVEVCNILQLPYKKIAIYLHIDPQDDALRTQSISEFGIETLDMIELYHRFNKEMIEYSASMVILAIIVTFLALLLMAFFISKLSLAGKKKVEKLPTVVETPIGKVILEDSDTLNSDVIVAVVAAIERYRTEKSKDHRIMLTWRRANVSMWQASSKVYMPNRNYNILKKRG